MDFSTFKGLFRNQRKYYRGDFFCKRNGLQPSRTSVMKLLFVIFAKSSIIDVIIFESVLHAFFSMSTLSKLKQNSEKSYISGKVMKLNT